MAGLRRPSTATGSATTDHPELTQPEAEPTEVLDVQPTEVVEEPETGYPPPVWHEPATRPEPEEPAEDTEVTDAVAAPAEPETVEDPVVDTVGEKPAPRPSRPSGKRRSVGSTQPADLTAAEAEVRDQDDEDELRPTNPTLVKAIVLGIAVLVLAALAIWFRGETNSRTEGADADNQALIDTARTSEVAGQVANAIEKSLSYNYTDLESTARAVQENLSGRALCEYDQLFGQVKKLAPEQKLVLSTRVRDKGVTRLEGDRAEVLVFVDQTTTRADQNQTTASGAQFAVRAERQGDKWKITDFDMLGQPLPNGQPLPSC